MTPLPHAKLQAFSPPIEDTTQAPAVATTANPLVSVPDLSEFLQPVELSAQDEEAELAHEQTIMDETIYTFRNTTLEMSQGQADRTVWGSRAVALAVDPISKALVDWITGIVSKGAGRRPVAAKYLTLVDPDVVSFIAAKIGIRAAMDRKTFTNVAVMLGNRIEDELRFGALKDSHGGLFAAVMRNLKTNPQGFQERVKRTMLKHAANKFGVVYESWPQEDRLQVGAKMLELMAQATGFIEISDMAPERPTGHSKKREPLRLYPTAALIEWAREFNAKAELLRPKYRAMVVQPKRWAAPTGGGYYHKKLRLRLIKGKTKHFLREIVSRNLDVVYLTANLLQETPLAVNERVLTVALELFERGTDIAGLPPRGEAPKLPKPSDFADNAEARAHWRSKNAEVFRFNMASRSNRLGTHMILSEASSLKDKEAVYFPVQQDFRGRFYYVPGDLNPQGCDVCKGLLTSSASAAKVLPPKSDKWLWINLANLWGFDKVSLTDREQWAKARTAEFLSYAKDPIDNLGWAEADKPFQFLAACLEIADLHAARTAGVPFKTRLVVYMDGSCNGVQHFAAMTRDAEAGKLVNLVPGPKPADAYQTGCDEMVKILKKDSETGTATEIGGKSGTPMEPAERKKIATAWLLMPLGRSLPKRPMMVLPYGGTRSAFVKYVDLWLEENRKKVKSFPFEDGKLRSRAVNYMASLLWEVLKGLVPGPRACMDWLRESSKVAASVSLPITWEVPSGFLVQQVYRNVAACRVETKIGEVVYKLRLGTPTDELDSNAMVRGTAPNFVHSLDAAALCLTAVKLVAARVRVFLANHDAFGTLACDVDSMQACLREAFVEMYEQVDVLAVFEKCLRDSLPPELKGEIKAPPARGSLDIQGVLRSAYFFA